MNYEQFLLILDNYKTYCEVISDAYDVGIDLLEGKFATNSYVEKMLELSITSHYGEMGWDWVSWFIYENDYGQRGLEARDEDGDLICQTHLDLYNYIETNHRK